MKNFKPNYYVITFLAGMLMYASTLFAMGSRGPWFIAMWSGGLAVSMYHFWQGLQHSKIDAAISILGVIAFFTYRGWLNWQHYLDYMNTQNTASEYVPIVLFFGMLALSALWILHGFLGMMVQMKKTSKETLATAS